jgi:hypothetical protein
MPASQRNLAGRPPITAVATTSEEGTLGLMEQDTSARQAAQEELVEQAQRQPGVAEAMAAYRAFAPYADAPVAPAPATTSYDTGGNAPVPVRRSSQRLPTWGEILAELNASAAARGGPPTSTVSGGDTLHSSTR